ncbi:MAG: hypothetical protein ACK470_20490, partial [Pseudanabaena sp.]
MLHLGNSGAILRHPSLALLTRLTIPNRNATRRFFAGDIAVLKIVRTEINEKRHSNTKRKPTQKQNS